MDKKQDNHTNNSTQDSILQFSSLFHFDLIFRIPTCKYATSIAKEFVKMAT